MRPIVVNTPLKSGTWLIRKIIMELTSLSWQEPPLEKGMDPCDPKNIIIDPDHFFSWHFTPTGPIEEKLRNHNSLPIFVIRNIYSMIVSMYFHFADNIDAEIGRGQNQQEFFAGMSQEEGIERIIERKAIDTFNWDGVGRHLFQMQEMLRFSLVYPTLFLTFEELVEKKGDALQKIADFLSLSITKKRIKEIAVLSDFHSMRKEAARHRVQSHFRKGKTKGYNELITPKHRMLIEKSMETYSPQLATYLKQKGFYYIVQF
ncbi:MAG: hypothetical protein ACD_75C00595G0005 [uncultured bacterium]|nr:MAG: hypothetical protein ACD_75C00595G0005 [uncultured bacterium]